MASRTTYNIFIRIRRRHMVDTITVTVGFGESSALQPGTHTKRFWDEYATMPAPVRTQSLPPSFRTALPHETPPLSLLNRATSMRSRMRTAATHLRSGIDKAKRLYSRHITKVRKAAIITTTATIVMAATALVHTNWKHAMELHRQPSVLTDFTHYPSWMHHDDAAQTLGLPAPISHMVPSLPDIEAAYKTFRHTWHPDKFLKNGFTNMSDAHRARIRGEDAINAFRNYYANPYCARDIAALLHFGQNISSPTPHFASGCKCTRFDATRSFLSTALVPFFLQSIPPRSNDTTVLASFCPCDFSRAAYNAQNWLNLPPKLQRAYASPWLVAGWDVRKWALKMWAKDWIFWEELDWLRSAEERAEWLKGGFAVEADFNPLLQGCVV